MKSNIKKQAQTVLASVALGTAKATAGVTCFFFVHQPKFPTALRKDK